MLRNTKDKQEVLFYSLKIHTYKPKKHKKSGAIQMNALRFLIDIKAKDYSSIALTSTVIDATTSECS